MHRCIDAHIHVCVCAYLHPCIDTYMHLCIYASMHPCIYASMHLCIYAPAAARRGKNDMTNIGPNMKQSRPTNTKICLKINQKLSKNQSTLVQKSTKIGPKIGPKIDQNRSQGSLGRVLGAILAPRWPKRPQDPSKEPPEKIKKRGLGPKILPKSIKNRAKIDLKSNHFFDRCVYRCLVDFGANLGAKTLPKWSQVGVQKPSNRQSSDITKTLKNQLFFKLFGGFGVPSWSQNRSKIRSKRYLKQDGILNGFWMALGSILGRFWRPSWDQVGSKIGPKGG